MTVIALNTVPADITLCSAVTTRLARIVDLASGKAGRTASESYQNLVDFALDWARSEPALVAQYHRDWFGC